MCGIAGIASFTKSAKDFQQHLISASSCLRLRGPDNEGFFIDNDVALAHRRLSVIDTSTAASQPFTDASGRYTIIYNGEFFNFRQYRQQLESEGIRFVSDSDTEVLLQLYIRHGIKFLQSVNGFFAFCIYDSLEKTILLARDRMGVKPLIYYCDKDKFIFASELKALMQFPIERNIDHQSLYHYFQFNYVPDPWTIYSHVNKVSPGHFILIDLKKSTVVEETCYYSIPETEMLDMPDYQAAQSQLKKLMADAVELRLVSDVPLGCFLSGGIDSSVITALAAQNVNKLNTFSIGFKDEPFFDETVFALKVAEMHNTSHHVFKLTNSELFENLEEILRYIDEPFADSSAIAVFILSKYTRKHVTVALSGDGADEMFGGYQKHRAEWLIRNKPGLTPIVKIAAALLPSKFSSRESLIKNKIRQIHRFAEGVTLSNKERYLRWCSFTSASYLNELIIKPFDNEIKNRNHHLSASVKQQISLNDVLLSDMKLVLTGDMLRKVDSMSMANSLEVRSPFLDYRVVDFAFSLTDRYKIDRKSQKKLVKDAFRTLLPEEIYHRSKRGFEVPLIKWFQTELSSKIEFLLGEEMIQSQGLFNLNAIKQLRHDIMNNPSGESQAKMWALIVFQNWWLTHHLKSN